MLCYSIAEWLTYFFRILISAPMFPDEFFCLRQTIENFHRTYTCNLVKIFVVTISVDYLDQFAYLHISYLFVMMFL